MKKHIVKMSVMVGIAVACLGLLSACVQKGNLEEKKEEKVSEKKTTDKADTYSFVDVLGEKYEAPFLEEVPAHTYELSRIVQKDGYKYYTDEEGKVISRLGIDVSEFQPEIDWGKVKDAGIEFAIIRMGYRGYGEEGKLVEDGMWRQHIEGAIGAGLKVGVYFFSQAVSDEEALEEASFVIDAISGYPVDGPVVFDTEEIKFDTARTDGLSREQFTKNCRLFCDELKAAGYDTMIYANMKWLAFTLYMEELTEYEKWYADYEPFPQCPYQFSMWQYTETGTVEGVEGNVDINVWFP